ncbi:LytR/AlgR family response regulator transcription factor [Pseudoduganella armeniaca]|uniref:DNA-binding response regulator n=1 Tax=Pseudoduganella armeniaca TaxID=2072590 RepID=A0A2R4CCU1_9BURK|nr:response regulator [Pseudoduganella armeniaca]AVR97461.1 DNA-binding response regulator [Pseudoduganella armeniaca]
MRVLIVDDERPARARLRQLLAAQTGIAAVAEARDGVEALAVAATFRPDVVFLDIQMPEVDGLEAATALAATLPAPAPLIVFVTAYESYALAAFEASAVDYVLKPCDAARLARTLGRLHERLRERAAAPPAGLEQLLVSERGVTRIVRAADILWLETADNYVVLHTAQGAPLLRQTLAALLEELGSAFQRCHRRAAVRLDRVERVAANDKGDGSVVLQGGARAPLSRQYRAALLAALAQPRTIPP